MIPSCFRHCCERESRKCGAWAESTVQTKSENNRIPSTKPTMLPIHRPRQRRRQQQTQDDTNNRNDRETIACRPMNVLCPTLLSTAAEVKKSARVQTLLTAALEESLFMLHLSDDERNLLVRVMQQEIVMEGAYIIRQGEMGNFYYIAESGHVEFVDHGRTVGRCGPGGAFGELALLYDSPRAVSCVAASPSVTLWKVDQATFRCLLARKHWDQQQYVHESIRNIDAFATLEEATVRKFVDAMTPVYYKAGDVIVRKGEVGNVFYSIVKGRVKVHDIGLGVSTFDDIVLEEGGSFGERALLTGEPRAANVTAITDVIAMAMDRTTFEACVGPMKSCLERDCRRQCLAALPIFKSILPPEIESLVDLMTEICYRKGAKLVEAGTMYDPYVWIIREGDLLVFSNKNPDKIFNLHGGDHFGDKSIRNPGRISSHTAIAETELTTWVLTQHDIESVIGDIDRLGETTRYSLTKKARAYRLEDLKRIKMLGIGGYGRVWMVQHKEKQQYVFALKQISKRLLLDAQQVDSVMREKQLLDMLHHKFILHLVGSFQDQRYLYLLLPVIPGGELFTRLQERNNGRNTGGMHAKVAGFYAACVLEALMHFHLRQVAYRDLKLENVLIDAEGYCKIVDLGFAKVVTDKTFTLVGTPEYLAPEIIMSKGYDKAVDCWSFGVLTYELLVGHSPFFQAQSSRMNLFKRIVMVNYYIPDHVDELAADMIQKLLVRKAALRLGNKAAGQVDVKKHPWFEKVGIDFKRILRKEIEAPWKPVINESFKVTLSDDLNATKRTTDYGKRLTDTEQKVFEGF